MIPAFLLSPRFLMAAAAVVAMGVAYVKGRSDGAAPVRAQMAAKETAWANERTKAAQLQAEAMAAEIRAHNATRNELDAINANAEARRVAAESQAAIAAAAASAAQRSAGRLRDAIETHRLATDAKIAAVGASAQCSAATEASRVLGGLLARYRDEAQGLGSLGRAIAADADRQHLAARECSERADAMIRNSGNPPAPP